VKITQFLIGLIAPFSPTPTLQPSPYGAVASRLRSEEGGHHAAQINAEALDGRSLTHVGPLRLFDERAPIAYPFQRQSEDDLSQTIAQRVGFTGPSQRDAGPEFLDGFSVLRSQMPIFQFSVENRLLGCCNCLHKHHRQSFVQPEPQAKVNKTVISHFVLNIGRNHCGL
jgi:hypothetical protein